MYHEIAPRRQGVFQQFPVLCTTPESFGRQVGWLRNHFEVINLSEAAERLRNKAALDNPAVVITSDDGWVGFFRQGVPVLRAHSLPATVYVTTCLLEGRLPWYVRWRILCSQQSDVRQWLSRALGMRSHFHSANEVISVLKRMEIAQIESLLWEAAEKTGFSVEHLPTDWFMGAEEVQQAVSTGVEIGAHTVNHPQLSREPAQVAQKEIVESKQTLEQLTGTPIRHFAYPSGDHNEQVADLVRQAGFETAVTTDYGWNLPGSDLYRLRRIDVHESTCVDHRDRFSEAMFALWITGEWARIARRLRFGQ